ncbi:hypothetical protein IQ241_17450 [Romeria aff. gracilis LEGE 07310]|uniref:Uncharacterized protein n=1 Tax=Vasconcelosia minhoensis LEGE 07310 TaxID=915328 RepID=A0A8J7AH67_9CYAN|nr:hypothetical protein [Romeria gracilis]MBE9079061.1 hypothetical protein [Romeria aff. gracilis LEGE 07310]
MFGTYQHSTLRIEVDATAGQISNSLTQAEQLQRWLWPQQLSATGPLTVGKRFESRLGLIVIQHRVEALTPQSICLLLSGGIDGFHAWHWGDGWVQSRLEGVSLLPLNLSQTLGLLRLRQFLVGSPAGAGLAQS